MASSGRSKSDFRLQDLPSARQDGFIKAFAESCRLRRKTEEKNLRCAEVDGAIAKLDNDLKYIWKDIYHIQETLDRTLRREANISDEITRKCKERNEVLDAARRAAGQEEEFAMSFLHIPSLLLF